MISEHLGSEQVSRVVYGTVIGLALVAALEAHPPAAAATAATILITAVAVGLAELYSEIVGARVRLRRPVPAEHRGAIAADVAAVVAGAGFPAVFFLLAVVDVLELDTAFTIAKWSGLGLIALYGFWAARLGGASHGRSVVHAGAVALIGAFVIALKALVH